MASVRLVQKFTGNVLDIGIAYANGDSEHIARVVMPNDKQINDDLECANAICVALKKRIRKSV